MSAKRRQAIFTEHCTGHHVAPCCLCGKPIHRHNDQWTIEHMRALGLLGQDVNTNCAPAHEACRREKDKADMARIAKAKRQARAGQKKEKPARGFQAPAAGWSIPEALAAMERVIPNQHKAYDPT